MQKFFAEFFYIVGFVIPSTYVVPKKRATFGRHEIRSFFSFETAQ